MPGIVIPMGSGAIQPYSRAQRVTRWKRSQEDYLRLVDYARADAGRSAGAGKTRPLE